MVVAVVVVVVVAVAVVVDGVVVVVVVDECWQSHSVTLEKEMKPTTNHMICGWF